MEWDSKHLKGSKAFVQGQVNLFCSKCWQYFYWKLAFEKHWRRDELKLEPWNICWSEEVSALQRILTIYQTRIQNQSILVAAAVIKNPLTESSTTTSPSLIQRSKKQEQLAIITFFVVCLTINISTLVLKVDTQIDSYLVNVISKLWYLSTVDHPGYTN